MAHALEIRGDETPATADGFGLPDLFMLPSLLPGQMFALFSRHLMKLKAMRRSRHTPKNWRDFYPDLRQAEWPIHVLLAEGARQILSGQKLDLTSIAFDPEPPESFEPSMPRSALAMHQRIEDTARFNADPERYVRRHAARISAATAADPTASAGAPSHRSIVLVVVFSVFPFQPPCASARRPGLHCSLPAAPFARSRRQREREIAPKTSIPTACSRNKHSAGANPA